MVDTKKDLKIEKKLLLMCIYEFEIVIKKYKKRVDRADKRKIEKAIQFENLDEVQEAFRYGEITSEEYDSIVDFFNNADNEELSLDEIFLNNLERELTEYRRSLRDIEDLLIEERISK